MKKVLLIALLMCCIGTFTACGKENPQTTGAPETVEDKTPEKETQESSDKEVVQESTPGEGSEETKEDTSVENLFWI